MILLQVPILAGLCGLFFRRDGSNFAERLVLVAYASSLRSLVSTLLILPLWYALRTTERATAYIIVPYLVVWFAYFAVATAQFYGGDRRIAFVKGACAAALSQALVQVVLPSALVLGLAALGALR